MDRTKLGRSVSPRQRSTRQIVAGLDDRAINAQPKQHRAEWVELRRRMRQTLAANAAGDISAADVVGALYEMGWDA